MKKGKTHYSDYLQLNKILEAQTLLSNHDSTDEMLFLIVHQAHELWFKQILIELDFIMKLLSSTHLKDQNLLKLSRKLHRIHIIQKILIEQLSALNTLSPMEFLEFREALSPASGFQSVQFRLLEIKLGIDKKQITHNLKPEEANLITSAQKQNNLSVEINHWLERMPFLTCENFTFWQAYRKQVSVMFEKDKQRLNEDPYFTEDERNLRLKNIKQHQEEFLLFFKEKNYQVLIDKKQRRMSFKASQAALFIFLYRDHPALQLPYQILSHLIQIDENLNQWRTKHLLIVQRMLGGKMGTGGSTGTHFLKHQINADLFSDLTSLSTFMLPQSLLPNLPEMLKKNLSFFYDS